MCDKNIPSCKSGTPGTLGTKSYTKIVNNYQLLTGATKTYIAGVTWHVDALLNLTVTKKHI